MFWLLASDTFLFLFTTNKQQTNKQTGCRTTKWGHTGKGAFHWLLWLPNQTKVTCFGPMSTPRLQYLIQKNKVQQNTKTSWLQEKKQSLKVDNVQKPTNSHGTNHAGSHKAKILVKDLHSNSYNNNNNNNIKICTTTSCTTVWKSKNRQQQGQNKINYQKEKLFLDLIKTLMKKRDSLICENGTKCCCLMSESHSGSHQWTVEDFVTQSSWAWELQTRSEGHFLSEPQTS